MRIALDSDVQISLDDDPFVAATMLDISRYGLSIDGLQSFPADAPLRVIFANGLAATGRSVWSEDFLDGIAFEPPLGDTEFAALLGALKPA